MGAKLENTVACALLRELQYIEDTTGSRVSLHYIKDKEKREVDFLIIIDNKPVQMVEVKLRDDTFSQSLFRFRKSLTGTTAVQIVYDLKRKKTRDGVPMLPVHEYLANLSF